MASLALLKARTDRRLDDVRQSWRDLIGSAQTSIRIVGGELNSKIYEDPGILAALMDAISRGVRIEIVHGPQVDPATEKILELDRDNENVTLYRLAIRPPAHFMVVDERVAEIESFHGPGAEDRQTFTKFDTLFLAQRLAIEFEKIKGQANSRGGA